MDFNKILQEASNYKMYNVPNQLIFLLVQHNNYTIVLVSYLLTRFQFLRKYCTDYNKFKGSRYNSELILFKIDKISGTYVNKRMLLVLVLG